MKLVQKKLKDILKQHIPFVAEYKNLGEQFIVSAKVHLDESTPHMHIVFIPVVHKLDKKSGKIISNYLKQLGYNSSHFGTTYLNETIIFLIINNYKKCPNLSKNVYPNIAEKFFTHSHNIKCDITLATKYMNSKNTLSEKEKFNIFKVDGYIYSKSVINYILKKQPLYPHRYNG